VLPSALLKPALTVSPSRSTNRIAASKLCVPLSGRLL
jgi:hypothetical protein